MSKNELEEFDNLIRGMDIPEFRKHDWNWLSRNLFIRNGNHPNYEKAKDFVDKMVRDSRRK